MRGLIKRLIIEGIEDDYKQRLIKDNPHLGMQMVNHYVNEFKKIKDNLPSDSRDITKYNWKALEDVVDSNQSIERIEKTINIDVDNSDVIYNQNNLKVLKANTKQACIKYGTGYGFCISSRGEGNQYYNYRYGDNYNKNDYSIYFVIDEDKSKGIKNVKPLRFTDPTHMLVIMVKGGENGYQVTTADNDGDKYLSWDEIVRLQPKLNSLKSLFKSLEPNKDEKTIYNAKLSFKEFINKWRDKNDSWLGDYNGNDLEIYFGGDGTIKFYTNDIDTLEFNYKLLKKINDLSIDGQVQVIEFNDTNYINFLTFITPLFDDIENSNDLKYEVLNYLSGLNLRGEIEIQSNSPIIKKDVIFTDGYVGDANIFKLYLTQYGRFSSKINIERADWVRLEDSFYRYFNQIEKLYKQYMNYMNNIVSNLNK